MSDLKAIESVIQTYADSMNESDADKVRKAFHPSAKVTGYLPDGLHEMSTEDFASFVAAQSPPKETNDPVTLEIVSLEIAGKTAVAQVRDRYLGMTFLDTLSFLEVDKNWAIYNKLFHVES
tara:strand:+ start:1629 stop:1991 length:363 start_codon:yes stop_codon:yes gene_type:complete